VRRQEMPFWRRWGTLLLILLAALSLVAAGVYGRASHSKLAPDLSSVSPYLLLVLPEATEFELLYTDPGQRSYLYMGKKIDGGSAGYVTVAEGDGEWGPMVVTVGWSLNGTILALDVPQHQEVMAWFNDLHKYGFFGQYVGRQYSEPLELGNDIDAVTGATLSSIGVAMGVQRGRDLVAGQLYDATSPVSPVPHRPVPFGVAEFLLLGGLSSVVALRLLPGLRRNFHWARYITLAFGLAVLGIWLVAPLSLVDYAIWMVGITPSWQGHLPFYILFFGVVGLAVVFGKNFYCFWLCPFAAVQEGLHFVGGRRAVHPTYKWHRRLRKTRYVLLWASLLLALLLHAPSVVSVEPWHNIFTLSGSAEQWLLVGLTLAAALIIYRFWCRYLCVVGAINDVLLRIRRFLVSIRLRSWGSDGYYAADTQEVQDVMVPEDRGRVKKVRLRDEAIVVLVLVAFAVSVLNLVLSAAAL